MVSQMKRNIIKLIFIKTLEVFNDFIRFLFYYLKVKIYHNNIYKTINYY